MSNREMTTPRRARPGGGNTRNRQRSITREEARNPSAQWQQPQQPQQPQQQHAACSQSTPSQSRYNARGGNRGKPPPSPAAMPSEVQHQQGAAAANESANVLLLRRVLLDEDEMQRRTTFTQQLVKSLEETLQHGDSVQRQHEGMQLIDMCILKPQPNVRTLFEANRPHSSALKGSAVKLISTLARFSYRLDLVLMWIFDHLQRWTDADNPDAGKARELKLWLLRVLRQTIADAATDMYCSHQLYEMSPDIVASITMFLDAMDTSDYLPEVLQVIDVLASSCPATFSDRFQDVMDLLVGWHIDPNLSEQKRGLMCDTYKNFRMFWQTRLPFAFELLQHFLSDMHGVIAAIISENGSADMQTKWSVCESFFSCFHGTLHAVVPLISAPEVRMDAHVISPLFEELRLNTLEFLIKVKDLSPSSRWMEKSNQALLLLFAMRPQNVRHCQPQVYQYFASQIASIDERHININRTSYLKMLMKFVDVWGAAIDHTILQDLLNIETSPLFRLRAASRDDKQLNSGILVLLRSLLRLCGDDSSICHSVTSRYTSNLLWQLTIIEKEYCGGYTHDVTMRTLQSIEDDITTYTNLLAGAGKAPLTETPSDANVTDAIVDALFVAYLLLDAAAVWPSFPRDHLLAVLQTLSVSWKCRCNDVFDASLKVVLEFCSSCQFLFDRPDEFELISKLLGDLYDAWPTINLRSRHVISRFLRSRVDSLKSQQRNDALVQSTRGLIKQMAQAIGSERNNGVKEEMIQVTTGFCQGFGSAGLMEPVLEYMWRGLDDPCPGIRKATAGLVAALNPFILTDTPLSDSKCKRITALESIVMATPHTGTFRPTHYEIVMTNLGMAESLVGPNAEGTAKALMDPKGLTPLGWAERLFYHCDSLRSMRNVSASPEVKKQMEHTMKSIHSSSRFLSYWAMWESTRYCILSRLRTPFGGPEHTLAVFERTLSNMVSVDMSRLRDDSAYRAKLGNLLLLLDRLEVQIYNASDGCATNALPSVPRPSLTFFRTNKKTCRDYYARIRPKIIDGAKMLHDDHLLIRHIIEALKEREAGLQENAATMDVSAWFTDLNKFLCEMVYACIRIAAGDLINGMQSWYRRLIRKVSHLRPSFQSDWAFVGLVGPIAQDPSAAAPDPCSVSWFQVGAMYASGHHEYALKALEELHAHIARDDYGIMDMLDNQALDYYTCIEDYSAIKHLYDANGSMFNRILSRELMAFAANEDAEPTCDLADYWSSMQDLNVAQSMQLGRLERFQDWLSDSSRSRGQHVDATRDKIDRLLAARAQLSLEGPLPAKCSMIEMQLMQGKDVLGDLDIYMQLPHAKVTPDIHSTKLWGRLCSYLTLSDSDDSRVAAIRLRAARAARKQLNSGIAHRWLDSIPETVDGSAKPEALYEKVKVLLLQHDSQANMEAMGQLSTLILALEATHDPKQHRLYSKACLAAARLLKDDMDAAAGRHDGAALISKIDPALTASLNGSDDIQRIQSPTEAAVDAMLRKSIKEPTSYSKPWFQYATHYYKQGWRMLDELVRGDSGVPIVSWAKEQLRQVVSEDADQVEKHVFALLQKYAGSTDLKDEAGISRALEQLVPGKKAEALAVLEKVYASIVDTFRSSVSAYFRYLSLDEEDHQNHERCEGSTSMIITATLRLLRMLVKYGGPLQDVFFEHVERVRIEPWKRIIPQLFARLNHPAPVVQQVIGKLLTKICDEYPREIIYDVIVSSSSSKTNRDTKQILARIANRMMERNEELWTSTQKMTQELERITVLWEEIWSYRVASLAFNAMELMAKLDQEVARLESNKDSMTQEQMEKTFSESYDSVMKFLVASIEKLLHSTILRPATKTVHEQWFIDVFGDHIMQAFELLQRPKSMATYREGWDMLIQINRELIIETHKVRILELEHVSPYLASLTDTQISVPGVHDMDNPCFIHSFGSSVMVLPTKTKPKKLDLRGSDGNKYSYLFKGMEDLHLDERVMQLLDTVNGLLSQDKAAASRGLKTRTYAVIPLSDHSGMIQWVNDATPLFALYKRWQRREQTAHALIAANDRNAGAPAAAEDAAPQRPTEMFMAKIENALRAENLRVTANRRHWPKHVLKKVFLELVKDTPGDLLGKELWCSSADSTEWLAKTTSFSRSLAVMSVIGYIIGLGDRHLDNMMVDYQSGEIIHIDYNVCFEKGRQLRVPELVPFRLTQNLFHALGITGVDGVFRTAAEETLRVLRKHKEVLMTLLDAFVYDPLVHWENDAGQAKERQMMELQANLGLVAARLGDKKLQRELYEQHMTEVASAVQQQQQQHAMQSEPQSVLDETSDDDGEAEDDVDVAKQNLTALAEDCKNWSVKHKNALLLLVKGTVAEAITQNSALDTSTVGTITSQVDQASLDSGFEDFIKQLSSWIGQRDEIYRRCADEMLVYKQLVRPVAAKLLDQDTCRIWTALQDLSAHSFTKDRMLQIQQLLQQNRLSRTLQALQGRAFNFASHMAQTADKIDESIQKLGQQQHNEGATNEDPALVQEALQASLMALDGAFRRLDVDGDENAEETSTRLDMLPAALQTLETDCHLGCFGQSSYTRGLLVLSVALEGHVKSLQACLGSNSIQDETSALRVLVPCASALFGVEDTCLAICDMILKLLLAGGEQDQMAVFELQKALIGKTDSAQAMPSGQASKLYNAVMASFESIDQFCSVLKTASLDIYCEDMEAALENYANYKRQLILCIIGECVKHVQGLPSQGWTSSTISSWAMTYNATVAMHAKQLSTTVTSSLLLPFVGALLQSLRQQLNERAQMARTDTQQFEQVSRSIQQHVVAHASQRMADTAHQIQARYNASLDAYKSDIDRFHWYNAPYIQSERPLFPNQLPAQMADGPERLHYLGNGLQALNDTMNSLSDRYCALPQWPAVQQHWQKCQRIELEKCASLMDLYNSINHLESCREGYTQAMIVNEYINNQLQSLMTSHISENGQAATASDETSVPITSEALEEIRSKLSKVSELVAMLKSPLDGIISLLESITIIEVDDDNELKPIHQCAKDALDQYHAIKAGLKGLARARSSDKDLTYCSVSKLVAEIGDRIQKLFVAFRGLEEFGLDRQGDEQKQAAQSETHDDDGAHPAAETRSPSPSGDKPGHQRRYSESDDTNHQETAYASAATQRRDAQVLGIMRRVRSKLEGRDFDVQHKMSVPEQVAKTIEQALSVDNLSAMYEGWTSWV